MRKEEIACNKQFLLFSQCLLLSMALIFHFKCTHKCCLQFVLIWTSLKFCHLVMGEFHFRFNDVIKKSKCEVGDSRSSGK